MTGLPPGSVIGILGGGQLGRMTALAAYPLGYQVHIFSPEEGPATQVTPHRTLAQYEDEDALARFADSVHAVTYEFENVPSATAEFLAARVPVRPGPHALAICQHRVREKQFLNDAGVGTTRWGAALSADDVARWVSEFGAPCVLKTSRFGYDGKGQTIVRSVDDAARAWAVVSHGRDGVECIVEAFVDFSMEASVVAARGVRGDVASFDLVENIHRDHILNRTIAPARVTEGVAAQADAIAHTVINALDYVGVLGIEMFVGRDGRVLVNELAPRPHNSGHWTQNGCVTSQFEQTVRAVMGLPLGSPRRLADAEMFNLIGDDVLRVPELLTDPNNHVHLYGKAEWRPGRKMGHVNRLRF